LDPQLTVTVFVVIVGWGCMLAQVYTTYQNVGWGSLTNCDTWPCWWKKSCTTWYAKNIQKPVNNQISYQPQVVSRISSINSDPSILRFPSFSRLRSTALQLLELHRAVFGAWSSWDKNKAVNEVHCDTPFYLKGFTRAHNMYYIDNCRYITPFKSSCWVLFKDLKTSQVCLWSVFTMFSFFFAESSLSFGCSVGICKKSLPENQLLGFNFFHSGGFWFVHSADFHKLSQLRYLYVSRGTGARERNLNQLPCQLHNCTDEVT